MKIDVVNAFDLVYIVSSCFLLLACLIDID